MSGYFGAFKTALNTGQTAAEKLKQAGTEAFEGAKTVVGGTAERRRKQFGGKRNKKSRKERKSRKQRKSRKSRK